MELFDSHTHLQFRGRTEFAELAKCGYSRAVTCSFFPLRPRTPDSALDNFDLILKRYTGKREGIYIYAALGVHPRSIPQKDYQKVIAMLPEYLEKENVVAIGEIGLEAGDSLECEVFQTQLEVAKDTKSKVIIHTPRKNKEYLLAQELEIIESVGVNPNRVIIDHNTVDTVSRVLDGGFFAGLTVSKGKLEPQELIQIAKKHNQKKLVVNTDLGFSSDYLFDMVDTANALDRKIGERGTRKMVYENASDFFGV
jgi:uncharacterized protein